MTTTQNTALIATFIGEAIANLIHKNPELDFDGQYEAHAVMVELLLQPLTELFESDWSHAAPSSWMYNVPRRAVNETVRRWVASLGKEWPDDYAARMVCVEAHRTYIVEQAAANATINLDVPVRYPADGITGLRMAGLTQQAEVMRIWNAAVAGGLTDDVFDEVYERLMMRTHDMMVERGSFEVSLDTAVQLDHWFNWMKAKYEQKYM